MKKCIYRTLPIALFFLSAGELVSAQPPPPPPAPATRAEVRVDVAAANDQKELIIRQKGDKDTKITLEIKNGDYFINGKPLEKFDDQNIIIEKREIEEDGPGLSYAPSPFRVNPWNEDEMARLQREYSKKDMERNYQNAQRSYQKVMKIRMNEAYLGVSSRKTDKGGATVLEITKASPAEKAGLKKGDIITKVNDTKIENPDVLFETIHGLKPGDKIKIVFTREGKEQTVTATLEKSEFAPNSYNYKYKYDYRMPDMDIQIPNLPDMGDLQMGNWNFGKPKLGIKAQDAETGKGVDVLEVADSSAAAKAGIKKGDVIVQVDGSEVNSVNELLEQTMAIDRQKYTLTFKILRNNIPQDILVKIPRKLKTAEL